MPTGIGAGGIRSYRDGIPRGLTRFIVRPLPNTGVIVEVIEVLPVDLVVVPGPPPLELDLRMRRMMWPWCATPQARGYRCPKRCRTDVRMGEWVQGKESNFSPEAYETSQGTSPSPADPSYYRRMSGGVFSSQSPTSGSTRSV